MIFLGGKFVRWVAATIAYDGTNFFGYQSQCGVRTVQDELEKSLEIIFKEKIPTYGCGRTDTGVHAIGQVVSFYVPNDNMTEKNVKDALNAMLPEDIYVREIKQVEANFNPRAQATKRIYFYLIYVDKEPDIFLRNRVWWVPFALDIKKMREAARYFEGEHDFTTFRAGNDERNPIRTVYRVRILNYRKNFICIRIEGKSFLRRMIRNMVSALVKVGTGTWEPERIKIILEARQRSLAPGSAPAQGLYFYSALF